jgi:hypothetical protein
MGLVALVAADSRVIRKYAKKKDHERRTRLQRFLPTSEIRKPVTQKSGVYTMERDVPGFQAWNGCGDSKERSVCAPPRWPDY